VGDGELIITTIIATAIYLITESVKEILNRKHGQSPGGDKWTVSARRSEI